MPGGDRTGPQGAGPLTGRAAGYCAGNATPGYTTAGLGRGYGMGRGGGGRGRRNMYYATGLPGWARGGTYANPYMPPAPFVEPDPELQKQALKNQADGLQAQLDLIQKRLSDLEAGGK
ncbi:MAG: DUF5320 domain-containing protein [Thermoleophilia bacterium]|nr:DUF5320 domain-containing protein [Thermoleophilia bacterium]